MAYEHGAVEPKWQARCRESGLHKTLRWYLDNQPWAHDVTSGSYRQWLATNYATRGAA